MPDLNFWRLYLVRDDESSVIAALLAKFGESSAKKVREDPEQRPRARACPQSRFGNRLFVCVNACKEQKLGERRLASLRDGREWNSFRFPLGRRTIYLGLSIVWRNLCP
jgi:hypothetical protein